MAGERILLIEDSADMRDFLAGSVLRPAGYNVLTAASAAEGLTLARDLHPDLLICDYQLPDITGLEFLRTLRREGFELPMILITAEGSEAVAVEAMRLGVSDYLIKPFDFDDLLNALDRVLGQHWTRQIAEQVPEQLLQANILLEGRMRDLDMLVKIGKRVTGQLDLQEILTQVVEAAVKIAEAEEGTLLLVDRASGELYQYASTDQQGLGKPLRLPVADSLAGQVVQSRTPLVITGEDLQKIKTQYYFRDVIFLPLLVKDEAIGVLSVLNRESSSGFAPHTLPMLSMLSDYATIAIENARLYAATERERDTLNTILRDTEDSIIVVDGQNYVLFCNPAACRAFGVDYDACRGRPLAEAVTHTEVIELFEKEARSGRSRRSEIILNDGARVLNAQMTIVRGVGRVVVMQDITHLKEIDRIKNDFVTAVSHDLRSPLTAILGYVEMVQRSGPLTESQQSYVERIVFSVRSITTLISDLLELGKIEAGFDEDCEPTYLMPIVEHAVESSRHRWEARQQEVYVEVDLDAPPVLGNPLRIRQMVANLIENATKYTPLQGRIDVVVKRDDDFVVLRVRDTGIGIPAKDQPYIFDKFFRTDEAIDDYEGTGLGLSIVKGIVDGHHGRIWVD
ncbi:MAG: response regulator, partial [Anaerolineae bacterium]|nr:response regulator [Anaerolineae bacterium]